MSVFVIQTMPLSHVHQTIRLSVGMLGTRDLHGYQNQMVGVESLFLPGRELGLGTSPTFKPGR